MAKPRNPNITEEQRQKAKEANARWLAKKKAMAAMSTAPITTIPAHSEQEYQNLEAQNTLLIKQKEEYIKIIENYRQQYTQLESAFKAERARNVNNYNYIADAIRHCFISVNRAIDDVIPKQGGNNNVN